MKLKYLSAIILFEFLYISTSLEGVMWLREMRNVIGLYPTIIFTSALYVASVIGLYGVAYFTREYLRETPLMIVDWLKEDLGRSGYPDVFVINKFLYYGMMILSISILPSIILYNYISYYSLLIPLIVFIATLYSPKIYLKLRGGSRVGVENQLPYFTAYILAVQDGGKDLFHALKNLDTGVYMEFKSDKNIYLKNLSFNKPVKALEEYTMHHPSMRLRNMLLGYTSILKTGGDMVNYLETKLKDEVERLRFTYEKYSESVSTMLEVILTLLLLFPVLVITTGFLYPAGALNIINMFMFLIPILVIILYLSIASNQPKSYSKVYGNIWIPLAAGVGSGLIAYMFTQDILIVSCISIIIFSGLNYIMVYGELREISSVDNDLPRLLRDLTEYRKMGYTLYESLKKVSGYSKYLNNHVELLSRQFSEGRTMDEVINSIRFRNWVEKVIFKIFSIIIEYGGGTIYLFERLTNFLDDVKTIRDEARSRSKPYIILILLTPVLLLGFTAILTAFMMYMEAHYGSTVMQMGYLQFILYYPQIVYGSKIITLLSAVSLGILAGRIMSNTAYDTSILLVITVMTLAVLIFFNQISMFIAGFMFGF